MLQTGAKEDRTVAKRRRHNPDQIIRKLAEGNKPLAGGTELDEPGYGPSRYNFPA
jgi:hypothetical protein